MIDAVNLELRLATRGVAKRVTRARRDSDADPPWAPGFPMEGDRWAAAAYLSQLPLWGGATRSLKWGYYLIVLEGEVVGGIGFHGRPRNGVVEVGYGVVPCARGRGVATEALRRIIAIASEDPQVRVVCGRTSPDNVASQKVMLSNGLSYTGRDSTFLHYALHLRN